jgi:hypothetical protein
MSALHANDPLTCKRQVCLRTQGSILGKPKSTTVALFLCYDLFSFRWSFVFGNVDMGVGFGNDDFDDLEEKRVERLPNVFGTVVGVEWWFYIV